MKSIRMRSIRLYVAFVFLVTCVATFCNSKMSVVCASEYTAQGEWGENISWTLDESGILTLSGNGEMKQGFSGWWDGMDELPEEERLEIYPWSKYASQVCSVVFNEGITNVADNMFSQYDWESDSSPFCNLKSVKLSSSVTEIGTYAFRECKALKQITVSEHLEKIGKGAFHDCVNLSSFVFPNSLTEIEDYAFWGCTSLSELVLPQNLKKINACAFEKCSGLKTIQIPNQVEEIGKQAFASCSNLEVIMIPDSVKKIGMSAFQSCEQLQEAVLPVNVKTLDKTFSGCKSLKRVILPKNVEKLTYTFYNCTSLEKIDLPESVVTLNGTFTNCKSLKKLTIPAKVARVDGKLFCGCKGLVELKILSENLNLKEMSNKDVMFKNFSPNAVIILPTNTYSSYRAIMETFLPKTVTYKNSDGQSPAIQPSSKMIDSGMWGENIKWKLSTDGVLTFSGQGAMKEGCAEYTSSSVNQLERYPWCQYAAFVNTIVIQDEITKVADFAFSSNKNRFTTNPFVQLKTVKLGKKVSELGANAFEKCLKLEKINFPDSLKKIGNGCFAECGELTNFVIPKNMQIIGEYAFYGCKKLKMLSFPGSVKKVMDFSFENCTELMSVVFSENENDTMILEYGAFRGCKKLKKVVLPDNVKQMQHTFERCSSIVSIKLPKDLTTMEAVFKGCKNLKSITIPSKVQYMAYSNFENCTNLKSVVFKTKKLEAIGSSDYCGCTSLAEIKLPKSIKQIRYNAFYQTSISSVVIPGSVRSIGINAFRECKKLKKITFEENVNATLTFERCCFKDCKALKDIKIPNNVKKLKYAFQNCTSLESVRLPKKLVLMEKPFSNCTSLKKITIPAQVTHITDGSFSNCKKLKTVVFLTKKWNTADKYEKLFSGIDAKAKIVLPSTKYNDYKKAIKSSAPKTVKYKKED